MKENNENKNSIIAKLIIVLIICFGLLIINHYFLGYGLNGNNKSDIKTSKRILSSKYDEIKCTNKDCDYVITTEESKKDLTTYTIYNINGKKIYSYTLKSKNNDEIKFIDASSKYLIIKKNKDKYYLLNSRGKEKYSSSKLNKINDELIFSNQKNNGNIINYNGKNILKDVTDYKVLDDYINVNTKDNSYVLSKTGNKIISGYNILKIVKNKKDNIKYLIIKDSNNSNLYYYDINDNKIVGESFNNYKYEKNKIIITKTVNAVSTKYILNDDGSRNKYIENKKINNEKFYTYNNTDNYALVNNLEEKTFGIYNIKDKKYKELFKYNNNSFGATVTKIDDSIYKINCSNKYCEKNISIIYNLKENKEIYKSNDLITSFAVYKDNYKVVKYANNKTVLYNNDKEIKKSDYSIIIIDKEKEYGNISNNRALLYSTKKRKTINNKKTLASKIKIDNNTFYRYISNKGKTIIYNDRGDKIVNVKEKEYISYTNKYIVFTNNYVLNIYNGDTHKIKKYNMKINENFNDENSNIINPYRGAIFINNIDKNYSKIISSKGKIIRKIDDNIIYKVKKTKNGNAIVIVKDNKNKEHNKYGLYIIK